MCDLVVQAAFNAVVMVAGPDKTEHVQRADARYRSRTPHSDAILVRSCLLICKLEVIIIVMVIDTIEANPPV